jgi:hypothetical protein
MHHEQRLNRLLDKHNVRGIDECHSSPIQSKQIIKNSVQLCQSAVDLAFSPIMKPTTGKFKPMIPPFEDILTMKRALRLYNQGYGQYRSVKEGLSN